MCVHAIASLAGDCHNPTGIGKGDCRCLGEIRVLQFFIPHDYANAFNDVARGIAGKIDSHDVAPFGLVWCSLICFCLYPLAQQQERLLKTGKLYGVAALLNTGAARA